MQESFSSATPFAAIVCAHGPEDNNQTDVPRLNHALPVYRDNRLYMGYIATILGLYRGDIGLKL